MSIFLKRELESSTITQEKKSEIEIKYEEEKAGSEKKQVILSCQYILLLQEDNKILLRDCDILEKVE